MGMVCAFAAELALTLVLQGPRSAWYERPAVVGQAFARRLVDAPRAWRSADSMRASTIQRATASTSR